MKPVAKLSHLCGLVAAWVFVAIGVALAYEVAMRYLFAAPTIWAEELSRSAQIWAGFLAAAYLLRQGRMIRVTVVTDRLGGRGRFWAESFSLFWIMVFSAAAVWYGADMALESWRVGCASSTMLGLPQWATELAIPFGFGLLFMQSAAQLVGAERPEGGAPENNGIPPG